MYWRIFHFYLSNTPTNVKPHPTQGGNQLVEDLTYYVAIGNQNPLPENDLQNQIPTY